MIETGALFWRIYGLSMLPVSLIYILRYFFDCIGFNKVAMCTGIVQMLANVFVAFCLIPRFGAIARFWVSFVGFFAAGLYLIFEYLLLRKKIFAKPSKCE